MIINKEEIFERIKSYNFEQNTEADYSEKLGNLEKAVEKSLLEITREGCFNIAYSGRVDSSLILKKSIDLFPEKLVNAFTIAKKCNHPDMIYSKKFIKKLQSQGKKIKHHIYLSDVSQKDIEESDKILQINSGKIDNYYMLMKLISNKTNKIICCDVIDELTGGYYAHQRNPSLETFQEFLDRLIPKHLEILDKMSSHFGVNVFLPYGSEEVMNCTNKFNLKELVYEDKRKKPVYDLARKNNIPKSILERRKYGLVSALD